jgi:hypothetical protein
MAVDKKEKADRFAFLIISASAHLAHSQGRTSQRTVQALQKSQIFPTCRLNFTSTSNEIY